MSCGQTLRALVTERLTAAAEEIFVLFERTIAEYEQELCLYKEEKQKNQRLLTLQEPTGVQTPLLSPGPDLKPEIPETPQIKEEQSVKQEEEQLPVCVSEFITVCVKREEASLLQHRQTEHREETQGEEPRFDSSDTDNDDDWDPPFSCSVSQTETATEIDQIRDRSTTAQKLALFLRTKSAAETSSSVDLQDTSGAEDTPKKRHQCPVCKKTFANKSPIAMHMRLHTGERPFSCSFCNKTFSQKGHMQAHMRSHTGVRPYSCSICNKAFYQHGHLSTHMRSHSGLRPYSCSICNKTFIHKSHMTAHMGMHAGVRPYSCSVCNKAFYQQRQLSTHMKSHSGLRPYSCSICNKTFIHKSHMTAHMGTHVVVLNE